MWEWEGARREGVILLSDAAPGRSVPFAIRAGGYPNLYPWASSSWHPVHQSIIWLVTPGLLVSTAISICLFGKPAKPPCPGEEAGLWQLVCLFGSSLLLLFTSPPPHLPTSLPGKRSSVFLTPCSTTSNTCSWTGSRFGFKNLCRAFYQVGSVAFQVQIFLHYSAPKFQEEVHADHVPETRSTSMKLDVTMLRALRGQHRAELRPFFY